MDDGVIGELRRELAQFHETVSWWQGVAAEAERTQEPESIEDCQRYDDKMREHASEFAWAVRRLVAEVDGGAEVRTTHAGNVRMYPPPFAAEPLGSPTPGVRGSVLPD